MCIKKRNLALSLLFIAVIVSGCADNGGGKVSGEAISISGPEVQPNEIFQGSTIQVQMAAENTGEIEGDIIIGENGNKVLTNYCPDFFDIAEDGFSSYSSRNPDTSEGYTLKPGERAQMNWQLQQKGQNVPLNGYDCPMKFEMPFNYSVNAYNQIQIKERGTDVAADLSSKISEGPLTIAIEAIGSSSQEGAPIFLEGDQPEVLFQISNEQPDESSLRGIINIRNFRIESSGVELEGC